MVKLRSGFVRCTLSVFIRVRLKPSAVLLFGLCCSVLTPRLAADQNAPELPALFDQLQTATEPSRVAAIESKIWRYWYEAPDRNSELLMSQVNQAMNAGQLEFALQLSNQLIDSAPEYSEAWNRRATIHYLLGNNAASVADIRETVLLEPRHFGAISGLGLIFMRENNFQAALDAFQKVLEISPGSVAAQKSVEKARSEIGREI